MTDICLITGNHPRHKHFANELISTGKVCSWIIEEREEFVPQPPNNITEDLKTLFKHHFAERERVEKEVFGASVDVEVKVQIPIYKVNLKDLTGDDTIQFVTTSDRIIDEECLCNWSWIS